MEGILEQLEWVEQRGYDSVGRMWYEAVKRLVFSDTLLLAGTALYSTLRLIFTKQLSLPTLLRNLVVPLLLSEQFEASYG